MDQQAFEQLGALQALTLDKAARKLLLAHNCTTNSWTGTKQHSETQKKKKQGYIEIKWTKIWGEYNQCQTPVTKEKHTHTSVLK